MALWHQQIDTWDRTNSELRSLIKPTCDEETEQECEARLQRISEETKAEIKAGKFKPGYISKKPKDSFTDADYAKLEARVIAEEYSGVRMDSKMLRYIEMYSGKTMSGRLTHHEPRMEEIPRRVPAFSFSEYGEELMREMMDSMYLRHGGRGSSKSSMLDDIRKALVSEGEITKMVSSMVTHKKEPMIIIDSYPSGIEMWGEDIKFPEPPEIMRVSYSKEDETPPKKRGFAHLNPTPKHPKRGK